jgi:hypothetical protein
MKKLILTSLAMIAGAALVHAQGFLDINDNGAGITTNTGTLGNPSVPGGPYSSIISGQTGKYVTASHAPVFDYAFLFIPTGIGTSGDLSYSGLTDGNWEQLAVDLGGTPGAALVGTNTSTATGSLVGTGGAGSVEAIGISGDAFNYNDIQGVGDTYDYSIALVGWSANEGSTWSTVSSELKNGTWAGLGNFGAEFGSVSPSNGSPGTTPTAIFGNSTLVLYTVPVPEPATLALAGLGGLSMLFLRRRKA